METCSNQDEQKKFLIKYCDDIYVYQKIQKKYRFKEVLLLVMFLILYGG